MVGFHVVDDQIVYLAVTNDLLDVFYILRKEIYLYGIDEAHFLVVNEIRVIADTIGQWPQTFEERLVTIVDAYIVDVFCNFLHCMIVL